MHRNSSNYQHMEIPFFFFNKFYKLFEEYEKLVDHSDKFTACKA